MSHPLPSSPIPAPSYGTSLVDRINVGLHLRRYLKMVARRWLILFVATALGLAYSLYKVSRIIPLYRALSELEVTRKLQVQGDHEVTVRDPESFYDDQVRVLTGGALGARVDVMILKSKNPRPRPPILQLDARRGRGSSFVLTVTSSDLEYAKLYAGFWGQAFLLYRKEQNQKLVDDRKYLSHQDILREKENLEKAKETTERYRREHQIGSASDTYRAAQQQLEQLKTEMGAVETSYDILDKITKEALASGALTGESRPDRRSRNQDRDSAQNSTEPSDPLSKFTANSSYVLLKSQLNDKLSQFNSYTNTLKPRHPVMVTLDRDIKDLNRKIDFQLTIIEDERKATLKSLALRKQALFQRIDELTKQVQGLRSVQDEFERLQREEKRIEANIAALNTTLAQIDLSTPDETRFSIVGDVFAFPVDPLKGRIIMQGVGMGFVVGLALIYLLNRLDDRLELAEDIEEALDEPVLGQVPQVDMRSVSEGCLLITRLHRHNMFAESIRGVRSAIMLGGHEGRKQAMLVSSAVPGDGKTTFTVNFAATMAIAGNRVLLIDADLRRGNIHNYFKLNREPGLTEVLMGQWHWTDVLGPTEIKTLNVITTGKLPAHPGELLVSPIMQQLIEEARRDYDYVIVDCPPLTAIDDAFSLIALMDGLLFVVRSGQTSMRFAKTALAAVRQRGAPIIGIVLNGITADNPYYYYNYYYHSYYNRPGSAEPSGAETGAGKKMAPPKARRLAEKTILGGAMSMAGQTPSLSQIEKEAKTKAELFKARRAARKSAEASGPGLVSKEPVAGSAADPQPPKQG